MTFNNASSKMRRFLKDDSGQILPMMSVLLIGFLGTAALSIDLGRAFYGYRELQTATNAAALAGGSALPNSNAAALATTYSALSGDKNAQPNMSNVTMVSGYPKLECLTSLTNQGMACVAPANANAIQVQQQMVVNLIFAPIFGKHTLTLTSTATASMSGAATTPYNVAVILDTTASMNGTDSDSQCSSSRLACAESGVQVLYQSLYPCLADEANCGTPTNNTNGGAMVANSVDRISLFAFPNPTVGTIANDWTCPTSNPTIKPYTFPTAGSTTYAPSGSTTPTYQIVGFSSDFKTSDTASSLNSSSDSVVAVGGKSGCNGMQAPGGEGTYYAGVIYAAQAALTAEKTAFPGSQNVMIILSDGDASATSSAMPGASTTSGTYPSTKQQCHQAVTAAQAAATAGTRVYAVAYGATSSGCSTDTSPTISPCSTMQSMASSPQYFYSDYTASGGSSSCVSAAQSTTNLNQIFKNIAGSLTVARLIPNNAT
ncbi:MAG: pilus assembly protein TadG-related protein [Acidobacteriota bacterium]|nr:pilus assembly protein TadG-related protein [Acidobacteriota bacterium]